MWLSSRRQHHPRNRRVPFLGGCTSTAAPQCYF
nr:MAG TPA: hypothetical protein [Caudoviricetes sp.]